MLVKLGQFNTLRAFAAALCIACVSGCASKLPKDLVTRLDNKPIGLFVDSCLYRANLANQDTFAMQESLDSAKELREEVITELSLRGIAVSKAQIPALCASMVNSKINDVYISRERKSEPVKPPVWPVVIGSYRQASDELVAGAVIAFALSAPTLTNNSLIDVPLVGTTIPGLIALIADDVATSRKDRKERESKLMTPEQAQALKKELGSSLLLVTTETDTSTSGGLQWTKVLTTNVPLACLFIPGRTEVCRGVNVKKHRRMTLIDLDSITVNRQTAQESERTSVNRLLSSLISKRPVNRESSSSGFSSF
jgi:hypothetical protein